MWAKKLKLAKVVGIIFPNPLSSYCIWETFSLDSVHVNLDPEVQTFDTSYYYFNKLQNKASK